MLKKLNQFWFLIALFIVILVSKLFHYKVHIENALTGEQALGFDIEISWVRTLLEPIVGPILYLNRGLYPLEEMKWILIWILIGYAVCKVILWFRQPNKRFQIKGILGFLASALLIVGAWFVIFAVMLFAPLPNNNIKNNTKQVLVTTHAHTEFSHDGLISQVNMWEWHRKNGFDAFFITDHANHQKTLEFVRQQRNGAFSDTPLVMVGQEHSGSNHMSLLGLDGTFEARGKPDSVVVNRVHQLGGAVMVNHWFDGKGLEKEHYLNLGVDGFEIENTGIELYYDRAKYEEIKAFCETNNLMMIGGLDFHGYGRVCGLWNALDIPNWQQMNQVEKEKSIVDVFKSKDQNKLQVLIYKDRPFYTVNESSTKSLLFIFNYFRTLNFKQVFSWMCWLLIIALLWHREIIKDCFRKENLAKLNLLGSLYLAYLAISYFFKHKSGLVTSEIFEEYSGLLGITSIILFVYSLLFIVITKRNAQRD